MDRRGFLKTAAGGLLLGFHSRAVASRSRPRCADNKLNAWVHVGTDDIVTLFIHKAEMGQGTVTSLSMLLAEELECDWKKIRTEFPGVDRAYGGNQGVVGSQSIRTSWQPLRQAGATAREMLIARGGAEVGRGQEPVPRGKQRRDQHRHQCAVELRQPGRGRREVRAANRRAH